MARRKRRKTRAEDLRSRRKEERRSTGRGSRRVRSSRSQSLPPMVARRGKMGLGRDTRSRNRTRRRFDVALGVTGAEVSLPAVPDVQLGWRALSGFLVVLILGVLYTVWNSPRYRISAADVEGIERLTLSEINAVAQVAGKPVFAVEPESLTRDLQEAFPELYDIEAQVQFPARVLIQLKERQPLLAWRQNDLTLWVDEKGVGFPPRGQAAIEVTVEAMAPPEIGPEEAVEAERFLPQSLLEAILAIGEVAPESTALVYDPGRGLGWADPRGWQVYFGRTGESMETRLAVYQALVEELQARGVTPTLIDMEHLHAPYYRTDR